MNDLLYRRDRRIYSIDMPTVRPREVPLPKNWQDFDTIVRDAQALR